MKGEKGYEDVHALLKKAGSHGMRVRDIVESLRDAGGHRSKQIVLRNLKYGIALGEVDSGLDDSGAKRYFLKGNDPLSTLRLVERSISGHEAIDGYQTRIFVQAGALGSRLKAAARQNPYWDSVAAPLLKEPLSGDVLDEVAFHMSKAVEAVIEYVKGQQRVRSVESLPRKQRKLYDAWETYRNGQMPRWLSLKPKDEQTRTLLAAKHIHEAKQHQSGVEPEEPDLVIVRTSRPFRMLELEGLVQRAFQAVDKADAEAGDHHNLEELVNLLVNSSHSLTMEERLGKLRKYLQVGQTTPQEAASLFGLILKEAATRSDRLPDRLKQSFWESQKQQFDKDGRDNKSTTRGEASDQPSHPHS